MQKLNKNKPLGTGSQPTVNGQHRHYCCIIASSSATTRDYQPLRNHLVLGP